MARRLRLIVAVVALLAWITVSGAWVLSYYEQDLLLYERPLPPAGHWMLALRSQAGSIAIEYESKPADDSASTWDGTYMAADGSQQGWYHDRFPFKGTGDVPDTSCGWTDGHLPFNGEVFSNVPAGYDGNDHRTRSFMAWCRWWMVWVPMTPIAGWATWRFLAGALQRGRCVRCGYDLRATPDHCPECGAVTRSSRAA